MDREQRIQNIIENVSRLQRAVSPVVWEKSGLSRAQAGMLYILYYHQNASMKTVASHLSISKSAVSQLLEPLIDKGLAQRQPDEQDRRSVVVGLTPTGKATVKLFNREKQSGLRSALSSLDMKDLETLDKLHTKMANNITN